MPAGAFRRRWRIGGGYRLGKEEFSTLVDQSGLRLTDEQKWVLFAAYPMFQEMVARATPRQPREAEPAVIFVPEVK
jgi:hypothetical protein